MSCIVCKDPVSNDEYVSCSICAYYLHFDCADVNEATWNRMGQKRRDTWKCKRCSGRLPLPSGVKNAGNSGNVTDIIAKMHQDYLEKMEKTIKEQLSEHAKIVKKDIDEIKQSMEFFSVKMDEYEKRCTSVDGKMSNVVKSQGLLEENNKKLVAEVTLLRGKLEDLEQYSRNRNIQIDGVPELRNEKLEEIIQTISVITGENINFLNDVQACHRVPTMSKAGIKPIIVQFTNRQKRNAVLVKAKENREKLQSTSFVPNVPQSPVYIKEHLTQASKELFFEAKKLKAIGYLYVWFKDGKVLARKGDRDRVINITSKEDVEKLSRKA